MGYYSCQALNIAGSVITCSPRGHRCCGQTVYRQLSGQGPTNQTVAVMVQWFSTVWQRQPHPYHPLEVDEVLRPPRPRVKQLDTGARYAMQRLQCDCAAVRQAGGMRLNRFSLL
ncbi:roundabout homolog 1 isoform X1 [Lates japonicus]|uniref:Roundabout homolog 1 isoform X1 n=1 Tax=Lates japonicus TaxID=270547 RepID=A0AAD3R3C1_LATJO|nr:roundabout homolog 1 isoform X1 [Lates japonicus]